MVGDSDEISKSSKVLNFDPVKFFNAEANYPEVRKMPVGMSGMIPSSSLVITSSGDLYICGTVKLNLNKGANVKIKRISPDAFELDFINLKKDRHYRDILKVAYIEEALETFYETTLSDFILLVGMKTQLTPIKRSNEEQIDSSDTSTSPE